MPGEHLVDDVAAGPRGQPEPADSRAAIAAAARDRLQATDVPAPADDVVVVGDVDVADVARRTVGTAMDVATGDDPAADAGADLHEHQERLVAPVRPVLAEGHDVHVVVDERRYAEALGEPSADGVEVPAGHDRRRDRASGGELDRPGQADADAAERGSAASGSLEEAVEGSLEPGQHDLRPGGDRDVLGELGQDRRRRGR